LTQVSFLLLFKKIFEVWIASPKEKALDFTKLIILKYIDRREEILS